jgi:hypothetical protein
LLYVASWLLVNRQSNKPFEVKNLPTNRGR